MAISINQKDAEKVLLAAFRARCTKNDDLSNRIEAVLNGNHKTYKYILVNGLLAKATNNSANPLALQAGSNLKGAFDARSLCHKVLVQFERDFLYNALGGSNEPFLNKPARFTELSASNAVRKGKDKETLISLIHIFSNLPSSKEAEKYLACALHFLNDRIQKLQTLNEKKINYSPTLVEIYEFILIFCEKSFEGETSVLIVATLEKLYHSSLKGNFAVIAHKVNQSGASSKEIGDIDVFKDDLFKYAIEVKDKDFTSYDITHAFDKIIANSGEKGQFIFGANANHDWNEIRPTLKKYAKQGFFTFFMGIFEYSRTMLFKIGHLNKQEFVDTLIGTANEINAKVQTREWIQELFKKLKWK
ncbi:MAG TPA: restriction endonuclease, SacI family [Bacteroidetes bacterium]|nr:restriction endonuclease, SacI family [Bacteroidota bacterium]